MKPAIAHFSPGSVLLPLGLGTALALMGDATLYTVLPTHTADAGIPLVSVGIILGVNRAIRLLSNTPVGLAYDRYRRRRLFIPALFIGALSTAIYAATSGFWPLLAARLIWGMAWSGIWIGGATIIFDVTTPRDRGRWTGLYQTWFFLGTSLGALGGGVLTDYMGYTATMWIAAAVTACGAIFALLRLPETRSVAATFAIAARATPGTLPLRSNPGLLAAVTLQGINRFVLSGVLSATLGLLVQQQMNATSPVVGVATATGILMSGRSFFSMASAPLCGTLSDWLRSRWAVMAGAAAIGLLGMLLMAWPSIFAVLSGIVLTSIASGGMQSLATTLTGDGVSLEQRGRAIGLLHTSGDLGSALGPPVAYALLPLAGLQGDYIACAALFFVGLILAIGAGRREEKDHGSRDTRPDGV